MDGHNQPGFLPNLSSKVYALRDFICDSLNIKRVANFWVLCPNRMLGISPGPDVMPHDEASSLVTLWGKDPVLPSAAAYKKMACAVLCDLKDAGARYTQKVSGPLCKETEV